MEPEDLGIEKSLLQKAVRRGNVELVEKTYNYLIGKGYFTWLKKRLAVIAYEECWPFGAKLYNDSNQHKVLEQYKELTLTEKNKDAAGLATLAYKYNKGGGKYSWLCGDETQNNAIKSIANAIKNPSKFWDWIEKENIVNYKKHQGRIKSAKKAVAKCEHDIDKATIYAAAYFAIKDEIPPIKKTAANNDPDFPYWVAIDKHTMIGKDLIEKVSEREGTVAFKIGVIAFYMEGSKCDVIADSPYWGLAKKWDLKNRGYTLSSAEIAWNTLFKPTIIEKAKIHVEELIKVINTPIAKDSGDQIPLF